MKRSQYKYKKARRAAYERDKGLCIMCGRPATDCHHVIFRSQLGKDDPDNLVCLCRSCHEKAHGVNAKMIREELKKYISEGGIDGRNSNQTYSTKKKR